jgi:hypothetical protein
MGLTEQGLTRLPRPSTQALSCASPQTVLRVASFPGHLHAPCMGRLPPWVSPRHAMP